MKKRIVALMIAVLMLFTMNISVFGAAASVVSNENTKITVNAPKINMVEDEGALQDGRSVVLSMTSSTKLSGGDLDAGQTPVCAAYVCWYTAQGRFIGCTVINDVFWSGWRDSAAKPSAKGSNTPAVKIWPTEYPLKGKVFVWTAEGSVVPISDTYSFELLSTQGIIERDLPGFYNKFKYTSFDSTKAEQIQTIILEVCVDLQQRIDEGIQIDKNNLEITYKTPKETIKAIYKSMGDTEKSSFTATFLDVADVYPDLKVVLLNMFDISASEIM